MKRTISVAIAHESILLAGAETTWMQLLDQLPDVMCWLKDRDGRFVTVNAALAAATGLAREEFRGKRDADIHPAELAASYEEGDKVVLREGRPLIGKAELINTAEGNAEWWITSKFPVFGGKGRIIGTMGVSRRAGNHGPTPDRQELFVRLLRYARENVARKVAVGALSKYMGMSVATLDRRIRSHFGTTPGRFLAEIRLGEAARLLTQTSTAIAEIAGKSGYENPAAFTRAFRKRHGCTPGQFRLRSRAGGHAAQPSDDTSSAKLTMQKSSSN